MVKADEFRKYLQRVTGIEPVLRPMAAGEVGKLPLYLTFSWDFIDAEFLGTGLVFALEKAPDVTITPARLAQQVQKLREAFVRDVVPVLSSLPSTSVSRLIARQVPFVVVGGDIYIPFALMLCRNRKPAAPTQPPDVLSAPAQLLVLMQLSGHAIEGVPLSTLAGRTGYSPMTLTNASRELQAAGIAGTGKTGRSVVMRFQQRGRALWDAAKERMTSPVSRTVFVRFVGGRPETLLCAGISALSQMSMLSDDPVPTFAGGKKEFSRLVESGKVSMAPDCDEADALVEIWKYDPALLGNDGLVDPLSLQLSLGDLADERVMKELEILLGNFRW